MPAEPMCRLRGPEVAGSRWAEAGESECWFFPPALDAPRLMQVQVVSPASFQPVRAHTARPILGDPRHGRMSRRRLVRSGQSKTAPRGHTSPHSPPSQTKHLRSKPAGDADGVVQAIRRRAAYKLYLPWRVPFWRLLNEKHIAASAPTCEKPFLHPLLRWQPASLCMSTGDQQNLSDRTAWKAQTELPNSVHGQRDMTECKTLCLESCNSLIKVMCAKTRNSAKLLEHTIPSSQRRKSPKTKTRKGG